MRRPRHQQRRHEHPDLDTPVRDKEQQWKGHDLCNSRAEWFHGAKDTQEQNHIYITAAGFPSGLHIKCPSTI